MPDPEAVLRLGEYQIDTIVRLLARYGLELEICAAERPIPCSYWGDEEAGLRANRLYARTDTPLHSVLHETCHYICADPARRATLDTNAGGDDLEECAVCYLQILLADTLAGCGRARMLADMDRWGYSFRLGSSAAWFERDADDARAWLLRHDLIDADGTPTYRLRPASRTRGLELPGTP